MYKLKIYNFEVKAALIVEHEDTACTNAWLMIQHLIMFSGYLTGRLNVVTNPLADDSANITQYAYGRTCSE